MKAVELFSLMMQERASTGRIYIQNVDHCNTHSPFDPVVAPVRQSNLCTEIALPTKPLTDVNDENGEIALCTLSAFNPALSKVWTNWKSWLYWRYVRWMRCSITGLSDSGRQTRCDGSSYAGYWRDQLRLLAGENGKRYSDGSANNLTHKTFEAIQYYLLKASNELAKEQGACPWFNETTYAKGILPIDTYKKILMLSLTNRCIWTGNSCVNLSRLTACVTPRCQP